MRASVRVCVGFYSDIKLPSHMNRMVMCWCERMQVFLHRGEVCSAYCQTVLINFIQLV